MTDSGKRRISARQILADIQSGMDETVLMTKYGLSEKDLNSLYRQLVSAGFLNESTFVNRSVAPLNDNQSTGEISQVKHWQCPSCHAAQESEKEECPVCGIVVAKFSASQANVRPVNLGAAQHPPIESATTNTWLSIAVLVVVVVVLGAALVLLPTREVKEKPQKTVALGAVARPHREIQTPPDKNALAIRNRATVEVLDIGLQPVTDLNFKTKAEVLRLREEAASQCPQLLVGDYTPSNAVFGQIVDGLPWWGILGAFHYGQGNQSISGPSLQSSSILNPYLLVVPEFELRWDRATIEAIERQTRHVPLDCSPQDLRWYPTSGRAEVNYDAECLKRNGVRVFQLIAYNARDLNLNYIYVSYRNSHNIFKANEPIGAYANPQFIHRGGSCGYPGGCNNVSPQTPPIDNIQILGWPAKLVIYLWERNPRSVEEPPDMEYVMHFK
ncbi:MAG: hypothetical protein AB1473_09120 [Thermodesulfobacteriota bacterium]